MFIFAADLHLKLKPFKHGPDLDDAFHAFAYLCEMAKERGNIPLVLGGDIFDTNRIVPEVLSKFQTFRDQYLEIPIYYINGNHDVVEPSWMSFVENAIRLGPEATTLPDGTKLVGMSWMLNSKIQPYLETVDKDVDFIVVHQFIEPVYHEDDLLTSLVATSIPSYTFKDFPAVLAGDIHKQQIHSNSLPPMAYPGSTSIQTLTETPGCLLVSKYPENGFQPLGNQYVMPLPVPSRAVLHAYMTTDLNSETLNAAYELIEKELSGYTGPNMIGMHSNTLPWMALHTRSIDATMLQQLTEHFKDRCYVLPRVQVHIEGATDSEDQSDAPIYTGQSSMDIILQCLAVEQMDASLKDLAVELFTHEDEFIQQSGELLGVLE